MTTTDTSHEARCLRPGCGRKLSSPESIARGFGPVCARKVREAARTADLSAWTPAQVEKAVELIEDGGIVRAGQRIDVFRTVSEDGSEIHVTTPKGCNCENSHGLTARRPCYHRCAVAIVLAATTPAPVPAAPVIPLPRPAGDVWTQLEALGATGTDDFIPAF